MNPIHTKDELRSAKADGAAEIRVEGELAAQLRKGRALINFGAGGLAVLAAAIAAAPFTFGASLAAAAAATGVEMPSSSLPPPLVLDYFSPSGGGMRKSSSTLGRLHTWYLERNSNAMALIICPRCKHQFDARDITVPKVAAAVAGAAGGAYVGSGIGMAGGPGGAMAGTIPGGIVGGVIAFLGASRFTRCPNCRKVFRK